MGAGCRPIQEIPKTSFLLQSYRLTFCNLSLSSTGNALLPASSSLLPALNNNCHAVCCQTSALLVLYPPVPGSTKTLSRALLCSYFLVSDNTKLFQLAVWNHHLSAQYPVTLAKCQYFQKNISYLVKQLVEILADKLILYRICKQCVWGRQKQA